MTTAKSAEFGIVLAKFEMIALLSPRLRRKSLHPAPRVLLRAMFTGPNLDLVNVHDNVINMNRNKTSVFDPKGRRKRLSLDQRLLWKNGELRPKRYQGDCCEH